MKAPLPRGTTINADRFQRWLSDFSGYRYTVSEHKIDRWIDQFDEEDKDVASRVLDCVDFITYDQMVAAFRNILISLPGWNIDESLREGTWRFISFSTSAGESGDTMLHVFRRANSLSGSQFNELFIYKRDLLLQELSPEDTVVFIDDFAGTGEQATDAWTENIEELLPVSPPKVFLILVAASMSAIDRVNSETGLTVMPYIELTEQDNLFSTSCNHFSDEDKETVLKYCAIANHIYPKGRGNCGFVIAFFHTCPNNSIPILHMDHQNWHGLFRRHD